MEANTSLVLQIDDTAKIDDLPRWSWMGSISDTRQMEIFRQVIAGKIGRNAVHLRMTCRAVGEVKKYKIDVAGFSASRKVVANGPPTQA